MTLTVKETRGHVSWCRPTHLVPAHGAELLQAVLGVGLVAGAYHTVLHASACEDVAGVRHDAGDVLGAGQAGHRVVVLHGRGHARHARVGALHGHQPVHGLRHAQQPRVGWAAAALARADGQLTGVDGLEPLHPVHGAEAELARAHWYFHHSGGGSVRTAG